MNKIEFQPDSKKTEEDRARKDFCEDVDKMSENDSNTQESFHTSNGTGFYNGSNFSFGSTDREDKTKRETYVTIEEWTPVTKTFQPKDRFSCKKEIVSSSSKFKIVANTLEEAMTNIEELDYERIGTVSFCHIEGYFVRSVVYTRKKREIRGGSFSFEN